MTPFKLLYTPLTVFQKVIKLMEILEIFELSQTSKRMFACIKYTKRKIEPIRITKERFENTICVVERKGERTGLTIHLEEWQANPIRFWKWDKFCLGVCEKQVEEKSFHCNYSKREDIDYYLTHCFNYLSDLFNNKTIAIWINRDLINESRWLFSNLNFEECRYIRVKGHEAPLTNGDMSNLLESLKPSFQISIECALDKRFSEETILNLPRVMIWHAERITYYDLLNMECEVAEFENHLFTEEDVKKFINHWLAGNNPKLIRLRLGNFESLPDWENILEGVEYEKWDGRRRPESYEISYTHLIEEVYCRNGLDFIRDDGTVGTLVHLFGSIDFVVWKNLK